MIEYDFKGHAKYQIDNALSYSDGIRQGYIQAKSEWVGLTDEDDIDWEEGGTLKDLIKAIEAKLKEKNGYE